MIIYKQASTIDALYTTTPQTYSCFDEYYSKSRYSEVVPLILCKRCNSFFCSGTITTPYHYTCPQGAAWTPTTNCGFCNNNYLANFGGCLYIHGQNGVFTFGTVTSRYNMFDLLKYDSSSNFELLLCFSASATAAYLTTIICGNAGSLYASSTFCMSIKKVGATCTVDINTCTISTNGYVYYIPAYTDYSVGYVVLYPTLICKVSGNVSYLKDTC